MNNTWIQQQAREQRLVNSIRSVFNLLKLLVILAAGIAAIKYIVNH